MLNSKYIPANGPLRSITERPSVRHLRLVVIQPELKPF
jgi:hypothetical protein